MTGRKPTPPESAPAQLLDLVAVVSELTDGEAALIRHALTRCGVQHRGQEARRAVTRPARPRLAH